MRADPVVDSKDMLHTFRAELAAAFGDSWDWSKLDCDMGISLPQVESPPPEVVTPILPTPAPPDCVTVDVAGADKVPSNEDCDADAIRCADNDVPTQFWVSLPKDYAEALFRLPGRLRAPAFSAAVLEDCVDSNHAAEFLAAVVQLERAGNILRQLLHMGLSAGLDQQLRPLSSWIGRACNVRRDNCVPYRLRLKRGRANVLLGLKPREKDEFVRFALSCERARVSREHLLSAEHRIRFFCDHILRILETDPGVIPDAAIVPLMVDLQELKNGGAP